MDIDDSKDQISLFDLTPPAESLTPPQTAQTNEAKENVKEKAPPRRTAEMEPKVPKRSPVRPAPRPKQRGPAPSPVPEGDVRLTANIRQDLHLKLKITAATRRTTIGELLEDLVERYL